MQVKKFVTCIKDVREKHRLSIDRSNSEIHRLFWS